MLASYLGTLIFLLPLVSLILSFMVSWTGFIRAQILAFLNVTLMGLVCFLCVILFFFSFFSLEPIFYMIDLGSWMSIGGVDLRWGLVADGVSIAMLLVVSLVSSLVHLYSIEYMATDPHHLKFMNYLSLFTLSMFILVTANNLVQMFIGWEGVGVCSFLLINFWDTRISANTSALKAIIVNRVGDFGLVFGFILIFAQFGGTFDYYIFFSNVALLDKELISIYLNWIVLFLFLGAVGKSAQVFLHVWLPDAMEGPTPVSALIHAATMVTAGVFLVIRTSYIFNLSEYGLKIVILFGGVTALFAGTVGMVQLDLKKVIAYSTCSQLGFMMVACGISAYDVALFHLAMHAFFKALLFLSAGSIIHAFFYDEQDVRRLGSSLRILPVTYICFVVGSIALMGFPYTAGFFSKDLILELLFVNNCPITKFSLFACFLAVFCTTFYSTRLLYLVFFSSNRLTGYLLGHAHESGWLILIPLLILSIFSLFGGFLFKDALVNLGYLLGSYSIVLDSSFFFENGFYNFGYFTIEELSSFYKLITFFIVIFVTLFALLGYNNSERFFNIFMNKGYFIDIYKFLQKKWYFDILYAYFSRFILFISYRDLLLLWDRGFLEYFGPYGLVLFFNEATLIFRKFQSGSLENYLAMFYINLVLFVLYLGFNLMNGLPL